MGRARKQKKDRTALTKENLLNTLSIAEEQDAKYIVIQIENKNCKGIETIINSIKDVDYKIKYYDNAYDDDLYLKANKDIRIINFTFVLRWSEIRCECLL